jgi:hypothetical protein
MCILDFVPRNQADAAKRSGSSSLLYGDRAILHSLHPVASADQPSDPLLQIKWSFVVVILLIALVVLFGLYRVMGQ